MFFFFNDTATTEIYTLSLHDALPIFGYKPYVDTVGSEALVGFYSDEPAMHYYLTAGDNPIVPWTRDMFRRFKERSEEHTSELQSRQYLVCRLLLDKKKSSVSFDLTSL